MQALNVDRQKTIRKGLNVAQTAILGVAATIATIVAVGLLVSAEAPRIQDGRWYGGWSALLLIALPLIAMTVFVAVRNAGCDTPSGGQVTMQ